MSSKKKTATTAETAKRAPKRSFKIDDKELITLWQTADGTDEVGKAFPDVPLGVIHSRIMSLRKKGVPLKKMNKKGRFTKEYVNELTKLAESLNHTSD